ncbi:MAG TPA: GGDEF domain-containing protein [Rectinemataceae bacterium]|nr:GGDEF domain-containing protein [Rectinemataceae bacterium]
MNRKRNTVLTVIGIFAVLAATLSVAIRLWGAYDEGRAEARASFAELVAALGQPGSVAGLADPERRDRLISYYNGDPRLLLVWVADSERGVLWRLPDRSPYLPSSENFSRKPKAELLPFSTGLLSFDWSGGGRRASIEAVYVILRQESVFLILRDAALGLGAWLLLALLVMLLTGKDGEEIRWRPARERARNDGKDGKDDDALGEGVAENDGDDEGFSIPELDGGEKRSEGGAALYSSASGLGSEVWLEERLDGELARAAAIEQDLSLVVIALDGLSQTEENYPLVARAILDFFSFRDLAFERGEDGFAIILPSLDATHALRMAEEFHKKLSLQLQARAAGSTASKVPLFIGLSSRAGRLVEARRLGEEAFLALERAREDDETRIVAFKPDPDKYRLWLASRERKGEGNAQRTD